MTNKRDAIYRVLSAALALVMLLGCFPVGALAEQQEDPLKAYEGKVISVLGDSISTFAGYIPVADGFNLTHLPRYPQDNLLTDVNETWWMQIINQLNAKLGINDSWRGSTVSGSPAVTTGVTGYLAAMSNLTQIQNLGSNGTPNVILFYGGTNDLAHLASVGTFDPATAPTQVDLTTLKWDNLADAYAQTLLRLKHFYPDTQLICLLPTYTASYYSNDKLAKGNAVMASICEHYGVPYVDLRYCGISTADLPDGIHPDATGMDYITAAVIEVLKKECQAQPGEHVVHSVKHNLAGVKSSKGYYKGVSSGKSFVTTLTGKDMTVSVTMGGTDITASVYKDGVVNIPNVTGDVVITAKGSVYEGHLQQLPDPYYGVDLWKTLTHDDEYFYIDKWSVHSSGKVYSVTFPVTPGEKIYASSFADSNNNGSAGANSDINGIRITWFSANDVLKSVSPDAVYTEFAQKGYVTVPDGAVAVNIPMWSNSEENELIVLAAEHEYVSVVTEPTCIEQGYTTHTCALCGHSFVDSYVDVSEEHRYKAGVCVWCGRSKLSGDWLAPEFVQGDYTMVVVPDTQNLITYWPEVYYDQMQWIADRKEELNIQAVLHMGDMVNNNNDTEWTICETGTDILNASGIPWMPMMGNHDASAWFNKYYDYATYGSEQSWFGGSYQEGKLDHTYWFVTVGDREYVILSLGWAPSWDVLTWAQGVVEEHSDKSAIIACHAYMNKDGTLLGKGDLHCVSSYYSGYPDGDDVWAAFKDYGNVVLAMGGHIHSPDVITWTDKNGEGKDVTSLLFDRQNDDSGNRYAMLAVLTFHADSDVVDVNWISTRYDALYREKNQFSITVPHACAHSYTSATAEPTCTVGGGTRYTCTLCGYSYVEEASEPLGHDYETVTVVPTCTAAGYTENVCSRCGHTERNMVSHDITQAFIWQEGRVISATGGNMGSDPNWVASDYVDISAYDSIEIVTGDTVNAGTTLGLAFYDANKKFISGVTHTDKVGTEYGILVHNLEVPENAVYIRSTWYSVNHEKYDGATRHTFYCKGYNTEVPALGHDYKEVVTAPTCTKAGYTTNTCTVCGHAEPATQVTDITERFVWEDQKMIIATTGEYKDFSVWMASDYVDISGYDFIEIKTANTITATTTTGLAFYDANKKYISGVVHTDKSGVYGVLIHNLEVPENAVYVRSTWYSKSHEGYLDAFGEFYCKGLAVKKEEPLGHSYESVVIAPTSAEQGYTLHTCTRCGDEFKDSFVDAKGYDWMLEDGEFKLLLIGNSYSEDASNCGQGMQTSQLFDILQAMLGEDVKVTVGLLYSGGKGINWHATQADQGTSAYGFTTISTDAPQWKNRIASTSTAGLAWTDWDVVSLQHYNINTRTGMEPVPYPDTTDEKFYLLETASEFMLDHIDTYAPQADVMFYTHWAQTSATQLNAALGSYNSMAQYIPVVLDYVGTQSGKRFTDLIPVGLSIQNARTTYLALLRHNTTAYADKNLNLYTDAQIGLQRDGGHVSFNIGRYIAALTFAETILPEEMRAEGYVLPDIRVTESIGRLPKEYTTIAQKSVFAAVDSWKNGSLAVTEIAGYTEDPTVAAGKTLENLALTVCRDDAAVMTEQVREAVLALLPVDFAVDAVVFHEDTGTASVTIRFGYTSLTVEISCSLTDHSYEKGLCVNCGGHIPGDINGDGKVNNKDATRLFQHLSGWAVEVVEPALDVNGDGKVNNKDATRLFQYLSGWQVEIH